MSVILTCFECGAAFQDQPYHGDETRASARLLAHLTNAHGLDPDAAYVACMDEIYPEEAGWEPDDRADLTPGAWQMVAGENLPEVAG